MVTKRLTMRALAGLTLWAGFGSAAQAQLKAVTAEEAFAVKPRQPGVNVSTPSPDQATNCKVEAINDPKTKQPMAYVVRDPGGRPVRQFVSYDGKTFNIIVFYVDGVEAYREVYPPQAGEPYQFRWLGPNGTKWGLDRDRDGKVDEWVVISPEELSQELLQAVLARDPKRAQALVLNKANLDAIGLQGPEAQKLLDRAAGAVGRVGKAADDLKATAEARWNHVELNVPQSTSADALGSRDDLVIHKTGTVLVQDGKETKFLQTGELVQVGRAWKVIDGPFVGLGGGGTGLGAIPKAIEPLLEQLRKIDEAGPDQPVNTANMVAFHTKRVGVLEQIVAQLEPRDQEAWVKQLADSLSGAAEGEKLDGKNISRLRQLKDSLAKGGNPAMAAYTAFRHLIAENGIALTSAKSGEFDAVQEKWRANLEEFVKAFPNSDEAPEAALRLAMSLEHAKDGEAKAKEWYTRLAQTYPRHPHAAKAIGAVRRLESDGKPLELVGPSLADGKPVNVAQAFAGKAVVVYYCANWSSTLNDDARKLNSLIKEFGPKGLEVVVVSLDNDAATAAKTVAVLPGTKLHAPGGLDASPLAANYGILVVPHVFVVGKDGKVVNRNAQAATVEDDVKKLLP